MNVDLQTPERKLITNDTLRCVNNVINKAKPRDREMFIKYFIGNLTFDKISKEFGLCESRILQIIRDMRASLKELK